MKRAAIPPFLTVISLTSLALLACGGGERTTAHPFARGQGNEAGPARGSWLAERGMFEPYRHGARFAVLFTIRNTGSEAVTLLAAGTPQTGPRLLRRIGVRFELVPEGAYSSRAAVLGLKPPFGAMRPQPLVVPRGREAWVQFNFVMGNCRFFPPGARRTYNRRTVLRYRVGETVNVMPLDLKGVQVTITAPPAGRCPAD